MAAEVTSTKLSRGEMKAFEAKLFKGYGLFALGVILLVAIVMFLELNVGLPRGSIAVFFILMSFALYAVIGVLNFTRRFDEYYVAGRKVPAFFNGMATGADWMSAASFISMAGSLYLSGHRGGPHTPGPAGGVFPPPPPVPPPPPPIRPATNPPLPPPAHQGQPTPPSRRRA